MSEQTNNKLKLILVFLLVISAIAISTYLFFNSTNNESEASLGEMNVTSFRPEEIVDGETETVLITGQNFSEACISNLGDDLLKTTFMNAESLEISLPNRLNSNILEVQCPQGTDSIELNIKPSLEELP
jgi:flagellar basal body-associated protein FliL